LGWVGEIHNATIDSTNILFTTLYTSDKFNPTAFKEKTFSYSRLFDVDFNDRIFLETFFDDSIIRNQLYS
jgi:hypothetical protein